MDPTRYWMLTRRKFGEQKTPLFASPNITAGNGAGSGSASYYESWEERAFAEDSAGHLGGCIWPPRSYSCSFCSREFRSAQALGGHMNVHRRDRARLKLAGVADDGGSDSQIVSPRQSYMIQPCPPQVASLQHAYIANPNASSADTNPDPLCSVLAHPPGSLVQASTARNVWGNQVVSAPLASLSAWVTSGKKEMIGDAAQSALNHPRPVARMCYNQELHVGSGEYNKLSILGCRTRRDFREGSNHEDSIPVGGKRRRIDLETSPLILCSYSRKRQQDGEGRGQDNPNDPKVLKLCPSSPVEELDLELRLGEAPKVK